jgi:putative membrane protein
MHLQLQRASLFTVATLLYSLPILAQGPGGGLGPPNPSAQSADGGINRSVRTPDADSSDASGFYSGLQDKAFVKRAVESSIAKEQMGQMALEKSNDDQVKLFAQKIADDCSKMIGQWKLMTQLMSVGMPTSPSKSQVKTIEKLKGLSGEDFVQAYLKQILKDSKEDDADFKREAAATQNAQLRALVLEQDRTIEMHSQQVAQLANPKAGRSNGSN